MVGIRMFNINKGPEDPEQVFLRNPEEEDVDFFEITEYEPIDREWDYDSGFEDETDQECDLTREQEDWRD